ncbi:MAG: DegT/DnrJ/EryC1/StrS family aminotransferase [Actinobacteria bacterium]|nr:DegT/DnrJ/EryC1/StrS family aminotransferase [Actinomycetota bacterium]
MISVFGSKVGEEEIAEIRTSIENQWIGMGPKTKLFEDRFAERLDLKNFVMLNSGSNSLHMALKLMDLPKNSEVVLPAFTWISCATAVVLSGCKPVFCDVDPGSQNVTYDTIAPRITKKTKAIMVVHYGGKPVKMEEIKAFDLPVIEDAAHAVDSKIGMKYCGDIGDIGVYSFDGVKNLAIGEAGGITSKNEEYIERAKKLRYCGIEKSGFETSATRDRWWEYNVMDLFMKMLPDDISASIGLAQLKKLDKHQKYRKYIWDLYQEEFSGLPWLDIPENADKDEQHSYFTYLIRLKNDKRDKLAKYLYDKGIYTTLRYQPLHMIPIYGSMDLKLKNSEILNEVGLNIPLHPNLSKSDIEYIIETLKKFGKEYRL